jgi:HEPN domain-containing protein
MTIDEFLRLRGTKLSSVVAEVRATVRLGDGEVLLAVGSIAEGLGNSKSDLDLLLITSSGESSSLLQDDVTLVVARCLIDVRILRLAKFEELLTRFKTWSQSPWNVTSAVEFSLEERTLLHRLLHGRLLHKGKRAHVMAHLPPRRDVARLKLHVARHLSRTIQVDMVGYREVGDYPSLVFAAQEVLGHAVDALLASYDLTNPLIKWRSRLLDSLPSDWEQSLALRATGLRARERVWDLHRAPEQPDEDLALEHAFRITTFARGVFMWAELKLTRNSIARRKPTIWPRTERKLREPPLPYLDFDVDFFLSGSRVTIARLNEFDETIEMSQREFAVALLFDGTTTASEAAFIVFGSRQGAALTDVIDRLVSKIARAGLSVGPSNVEQSLTKRSPKKGS